MNKLVPAFLKKLDKYLLLHQPEIWVSKIHYVAFYCLLSFLSVFAFTYLLDVQKNSIPTYEMAWAFLSLPLLVGLVIWIRKIVQYNPVREFANTNLLAEYKIISALFFGFVMFFSIPFASTSAGKLKVNTVISTPSYTSDSIAFARAEFLFFSNNIISEEGEEIVVQEGGVGSNYYSEEHRLPNDKATLLTYLQDFRKVYNDYYKGENIQYNQLSDEALYTLLFVQKRSFDLELYGVSRQLKKVRRYKTLDVFSFILVTIFTGFISLFTLLLYSFKNSRRKDFLFGIIALVLLPEVLGFVGFVVGLFIMLGAGGVDKENVMVFFMALPYLVLIPIVVKAMMGASFKRLYGVSLIMLHLLCLVLPWALVGWYDGMSGVHIESEVYEWTVFMSAIGMVILTPILFKPMYQKLYAMPAH